MNTAARPPARADALPASRLAAARLRVETSRGRLIGTFYPDPPNAPQAANTAPDGPGLGAWVSALGTEAGWVGLRRLALQWWRRQPWHGPVQLVAGTLARQTRPLVRQHPWAALAAAALIGATLVTAGPWLTRSSRGLTVPLRHRLVGSLWATLGSASVQVALAGALAAWLERISRAATATSETTSAAQGADAAPPPPATESARS